MPFEALIKEMHMHLVTYKGFGLRQFLASRYGKVTAFIRIAQLPLSTTL